MNNTIEVENLTKYYGVLLAVDHINFSVKQGEIFGFLGPNGAGKTTTQRMLTTLLTPTEGRIRINGHDLARDARRLDLLAGAIGEQLDDRIEQQGLRRLPGAAARSHWRPQGLRSRPGGLAVGLRNAAPLAGRPGDTWHRRGENDAMFGVESVQVGVSDLHGGDGLQLGGHHRLGDLVLHGTQFFSGSGLIAAQRHHCLPQGQQDFRLLGGDGLLRAQALPASVAQLTRQVPMTV